MTCRTVNSEDLTAGAHFCALCWRYRLPENRCGEYQNTKAKLIGFDGKRWSWRDMQGRVN